MEQSLCTTETPNWTIIRVWDHVHPRCRGIRTIPLMVIAFRLSCMAPYEGRSRTMDWFTGVLATTTANVHCGIVRWVLPSGMIHILLEIYNERCQQDIMEKKWEKCRGRKEISVIRGQRNIAKGAWCRNDNRWIFRWILSCQCGRSSLGNVVKWMERSSAAATDAFSNNPQIGARL